MHWTGISTGVGNPHCVGHSNSWRDFSTDKEENIIRSRRNRYGTYLELKGRCINRFEVKFGKAICTKVAEFTDLSWKLKLSPEAKEDDKRKIHNLVKSLSELEWEKYKSDVDGTSFLSQIQEARRQEQDRKHISRMKPNKSERRRRREQPKPIRLY